MFTACGSTSSVKSDEVITEGDSSLSTSGDTGKKDICIAISSDIISMDPSAQNDTITIYALDMLYNKLFRYDENLKPIPDLVDTYKQISDLEWEIHIVQNVLFHDGSQLTAEDVKFSLDRAKESKVVQHLFFQIDKVDVVDKYTVLITTKVPYSALPDALCHPGSGIVSKAYVENGGDFSNPVGTGPFKFKSRVLGDSLTVERYDNYFKKDSIAKSDSITLKVIPEATSRTIALETGEVDVVTSFETVDYARVTASDTMKVYKKNSIYGQNLCLNVNNKYLSNKLVRQAIQYAIDKDSIIEVAINGLGIPSYTVVPQSTLGYIANPCNYEYNPEKAKELLAQAGYKDGFSITLWTSGDERNRIAQVVQANLAEIGIKVQIELFEWAAFIETTGAGNHEMCIISWNCSPEPDLVFPVLWGTGSIGGSNRSQYSNPELDDLLQEARVELDHEKRILMYQEAQRILMEDSPWIPIYYVNQLVAANSSLQGVELNPKGLFNMEKLHY